MMTDKRMGMKGWSSDCAVRNVIKKQRRNFWKVLFSSSFGRYWSHFCVLLCVFATTARFCYLDSRYLDFKVCKEDWKDAGVTDEAGEGELVPTRSVSFQLCQIYMSILSNLGQLFSLRNTCQRPRPPLD